MPSGVLSGSLTAYSCGGSHGIGFLARTVFPFDPLRVITRVGTITSVILQLHGVGQVQSAARWKFALRARAAAHADRYVLCMFRLQQMRGRPLEQAFVIFSD